MPLGERERILVGRTACLLRPEQPRIHTICDLFILGTVYMIAFHPLYFTCNK